MAARHHLDAYLEGSRLGDGEKSLQATAPGFFYDDPNSGRIERDEFVQFVDDFKAAAARLNGSKLPDPFLTYTDVVIQDCSTRAWCWWRATNTELQGAALIKFDDTGVLSERIAYFSKLPT